MSYQQIGLSGIPRNLRPLAPPSVMTPGQQPYLTTGITPSDALSSSSSSGSTTGAPSDARVAALKWLGAIAALWLVLTVMADIPDTAELAAALALLILFTVLMTQGPQALVNLGFLSGGSS